ncbi:putative sensor histidine kinase/response regulator [Aspergillus homomorphus CBS 101889]|uniref:Putative sensor histidine kinase/response regulator n=1 Tax=Aspergillus homomorphus (strain CBS 101889) TaxID=1450537 RepID=A0A395HLF3_ASPHC|nr:putative sensor histidine kinase/response regulator [Aspergillus homomorphus CBS 101889]RAL08055.1 putative sensor histidine kinase/response regulator [Aspergillus homomorphus CBS 101889]
MAQEREFYKYCQLPQRPGLLHRPPTTPSSEEAEDELPQSSQDTTLTALAQLGALRLNARRCMISLFDRHTQYILAEATRTLSLQDDRVHQDGDALWLGSSAIPKCDGVCHYVCDYDQLNAGQEAPRDGGGHFALVIPDMTKDDRTRQRGYVVNAPYLRFYAGVPIHSRRGIVIGAFAVSDGETRAGLDELELRFLKDTAAAIMNHLEMVRSQQQNLRGANMIAGLGRFLEGGLSLPLGLRSKSADNWELSDKQMHLRWNPASRTPGYSSPRESRDHRESKETGTPKEASSPSASSLNAGLENTPNRGKAHDATRATENATSKKSPLNKTLSSGTREILNRAAYDLRESLDVEGVVFFDASVRSYGGLMQSGEARHSDLEISTTSGSGESGSDSEHSTVGHSSTETDESALCEVLSLSTTPEEATIPIGSFDESYLRSLLHHHPRGGIFNIDENGWVSSSEGSDGATGSTLTREIVYRRREATHGGKNGLRSKRQKLTSREECKALHKVFPHARSVILFPVWDSRRNRWFSGVFAWTTSPRAFSSRGELAYLYAFTNSIMAEIHRLDIELANKANRTLVSSISHELRSPLHGILGSTELLSDSSMTPPQVALVQTIENCGRSLLDIINNMLDFAKINQFTRKSRTGRLKAGPALTRRQANSGRALANKGPSEGIVNLITDVQLDTVLEEVMDTVFAGHCFATTTGFLAQGGPVLTDQDRDGDYLMSNTPQRPRANEPLTVIYDVEPGLAWLFETQAGVWRRILMNIFGNALKYTRSGHIVVSLKSPASNTKAKRIPFTDPFKHELAGIVLSVKDTGQGIDKEYLKSNIFKPFSQEDPLSPGSGLGLSIVYQAVQTMGGKIDINSTRGMGTEVTVSVDLLRSPSPGPNSDKETRTINKAQQFSRGKSIGLLGFGGSEKAKDEGLALLRTSLTSICQDHLGMQVGLVPWDSGDAPLYDVYLVQHSDFDHVDSTWASITGRALTTGQEPKGRPPVVVVCPTPQEAQKMAATGYRSPSSAIYEFVSQPCGPTKMATAVMTCIQRREQQQTQSVTAKVDATLEEKPGTQPTKFTAAYHATTTDVQTKTSSGMDIALTTSTTMVSTTTSSKGDSVTKILAIETTKRAPSVLLVDDNEVNLKLLVAFMKKAKLSYFTATNGLEALEVFKANAGQIQIILMDISMPVMDGLESTRQIRLFEEAQQELSPTSVPAAKPAVIIALTGLGSATVRHEALTHGVDIFLSKPVRFQELIKHIGELVH